MLSRFHLQDSVASANLFIFDVLLNRLSQSEQTNIVIAFVKNPTTTLRYQITNIKTYVVPQFIYASHMDDALVLLRGTGFYFVASSHEY